MVIDVQPVIAPITKGRKRGQICREVEVLLEEELGLESVEVGMVVSGVGDDEIFKFFIFQF